MKETKPCKTGLPECDRTLPVNSKHEYCRRCRNYDRLLTKRRGHWLVERHHTISRWDNWIIRHMPKEERRNVVRIETRRSADPVKPKATTTTMARAMSAPMRKRAMNG